MPQGKLSEFRFVPRTDEKLVQIPCFLGGDFGREVDAEIQGKYGKFGVISKIGYDDESRVVAGSNPFYVVTVNEVLRSNGLDLRTATPADLERALKTGQLPLKGHYEDTALVLRSEDEPNAYLAKNLAGQIKSRHSKQEMPVMIPLSGLELQEDSDSNYGLAFRLTEQAEVIHTPILNQGDGYFSFADIDENTGLPKQLSGGDRYFYTRSSGLSRLYLNGCLYLNSGWGSLANSVSGGRVVVDGGEATANRK